MDRAGARVNRLPRRLLVALAIGPAAGLTVFYIWPFTTLLVEAVGAGSIGSTLGRASTWDVVWFTTWQAVLSTVLTIVIGLAPAYVIARFDFLGRTALLGC
jgi:thiamine transport system permease protein